MRHPMAERDYLAMANGRATEDGLCPSAITSLPISVSGPAAAALPEAGWSAVASKHHRQAHATPSNSAKRHRIFPEINDLSQFVG